MPLGQVKAFRLPTRGELPWAITGASAHNRVWFTEINSGVVGEIDPAATKVTEVPDRFQSPLIGIACANDGAVWVVCGAPAVARYEYMNELHQTHQGQTLGRDLTRDPDPTRPAMWVADPSGNRIVRLRYDCTPLASFAVPTPGADLYSIVTAPDGNLWFTERQTNKIGRLTPAGVFTEFRIPTADSAPKGLTVGPDGALWFTESATTANKIGRITTTGVITEFPIPTASSEPEDIASGSDGRLWFTEKATGKVGRLDPATGKVTEYPAGVRPLRITAGPDGHMWFTRQDGVARITTH